MAKKYIDADLLRKEVKRNEKAAHKAALGCADRETRKFHEGKDAAYQFVGILIFSLQQEQPIKVYRVENEKEQKGLWRKFDGTWEPLFDMLTDGRCKDMPMEDSPIYREGGKRWFASAPSKETLQKWFSRRDLEELTAAGFTITEFEVLEYRKLSDFEYIFTRESIVNKTNINVTDIYPKEQPENGLDVTEFCKPIAPEIAECVADHWWEMLDGKDAEEKQPEVDLEEEADRLFFSLGWYEGDHDQPMLDCISLEEFRGIARHFYELGKNSK